MVEEMAKVVGMGAAAGVAGGARVEARVLLVARAEEET